ncbi:MAG: PKD domain-containing protein [Pseudomonadota bacterium]
MTRGHLLLLPLTFLLVACFDETDETTPAVTIPDETPDSFLQYLNTQSSLAAGDYEIVAATAVPGQTGTYEIVVTRDDGTRETLTGSWTLSAGQDPADPANPHHPFSMARAGGVTIAMTSGTVDGYLYLVRAADDYVLAEDDNSGATGPLIDLPLSKISSAAYAEAYYAAVDPLAERTTLDDYKRKNCFTAGDPACAAESVGMGEHVVFRDSKDLGYGRNMYGRRNTQGTPATDDDTFAFFVDNYVVRLQKGSSSNYGPINVEAAVRENREYLQGTNAIEFSPDPNNPSQKITKFFTFNKAGERITSADLDGRGVKHMPGMCWVCHGGRLYPLDENGDFPAVSLRSAKFNQLEVDSFEYSSLAGWGLGHQQEEFRALNMMVRDSYVDMAARPADEQAKWHADFALDIVNSRYGDSSFSSPTYLTGQVPPGWQQDISRPEGVEELYVRVIEPHCIACHSLQGNSAGENSGEPMAAAINFSSWEKFYSYRVIVADYVYRRGVMPLSLRNWEDFWSNPDDKPAFLATFLGDPSLFDDGGKVVRPGKPVARPGADRQTPSPVQLDGAASSFALTYQWEIVSPQPTTATLDNPSSARPVLTAPVDGQYVLSLTVGNGLGLSAAEQVVVTIDSAAPLPSSLTFVDDIAPILGSNTGTECAACHNASGGYPGIPVYWSLADNDNLYRDVLARVNLAEPENSLLLVKPTGERHGGGEFIDLGLLAGQEKYNTILEWIRAGAPCGNDPVVCN